MKLLIFSIPFALFLSLTFVARSQEIFQPASRSQAMGGIFAPLSGPWAVFGNQAGMAGVTRPVVGGSFQNRFLVSELSDKTGFLLVPVKSSVFAVSFYQFGKAPFRSGKVGFAYARSFGHRLSLGLQFNRYSLYLPEEKRSVATAGAELGGQYLLNEKLVIGLHVSNPYRAKIHLYSGDYSFDSVIAAGFFYRLSDAFSFLAEAEQRSDDDLRIKTGFEYCIREVIFIRGGVAGKPYKLSGGAGFCLGNFTVDLAASYHQNLGSSPSVSFQYQF